MFYLVKDDAIELNAERIFMGDDENKIVRAVNAHDELVAALKSARSSLIVHESYGHASPDALAKINAALSKAEGK